MIEFQGVGEKEENNGRGVVQMSETNRSLLE